MRYLGVAGDRPEMRQIGREPVEPEPVRTGGGKVCGILDKALTSLRPSQWRSEA